jgi:nitrite reductase/ring-hydroxylating ferredoxin subunit
MHSVSAVTFLASAEDDKDLTMRGSRWQPHPTPSGCHDRVDQHRSSGGRQRGGGADRAESGRRRHEGRRSCAAWVTRIELGSRATVRRMRPIQRSVDVLRPGPPSSTTERTGPMDAGPAALLFERGVLTVAGPHGASVLVINTRRGPVALEGRCPHMGAALSPDGVRGSTIRCEGHGFRYDLHSGACRTRHRLAGRLRTYGAWIDDGRVIVDLSSS